MERITNLFVKLVSRFLPEAFYICLVLTLVTMAFAMALTPNNLFDIMRIWGGGFWDFLAFSMQIAMILVTGMVLVTTVPVQNLLYKIADTAKTPTRAYLLTALVSLAAYYLSWGIAVVAGGLFARAVARRVPGLHFPLLLPIAFTGVTIWHFGFSGSAPLAVATPGHVFEDIIGVIPISQTSFAPGTLIILLVLAVTVPLGYLLMVPRDKSKIKEADPKVFEEEELSREMAKPLSKEQLQEMAPAARWEYYPWVGRVMGVIGVVYVLWDFQAMGIAGLNLNTLNLLFLSLGIFIHGSPAKVTNSFKAAAPVAAPILLQYPFYAAIAALMIRSGLGTLVTEWFTTLPLNYNVASFWAAGLVNILVPGGGAQWGVMGGVLSQGAISLGIDPAVSVVAVGFGDSWTNLIQPYWFLPMLAITKMHIRDVMGYCILMSIWVGLVMTVGMWLLF